MHPKKGEKQNHEGQNKVQRNIRQIVDVEESFCWTISWLMIVYSWESHDDDALDYVSDIEHQKDCFTISFLWGQKDHAA